MRVRNEVRRVHIATLPGREVDALVRVRGIDATAGGQGVVAGSEDPLALIVRTPEGERRMQIETRQPPVAAIAVVPVLAYTLGRFIVRRRRRRS
jgi:hypothetical protein